MELEAIAKAIEIIFNPNVADSYAGHIKLVQTNFLQMTSSSRRALVKDRAAEMLSISGKLSLMWGDYKDRINELTMEMNKNALVFDELKITLDDQIKIFVNSKPRISILGASPCR